MTTMMSEVRREIVAGWPEICRRAGMPYAEPYLPKAPKLIGSSTKVRKGEGRGYLTGVVYMSPADEAFHPNDKRTMCPMSTPGCRAVCLGAHSGRMVMRPSARSRLWKTALFLGSRRLFGQLLFLEASALQDKADREGMGCAVRVDGSSDAGFGLEMAKAAPEIQWYDYTKVPSRWFKAQGVPNYHVTYSVTNTYGSVGAARTILSAGGNVAMVTEHGFPGRCGVVKVGTRYWPALDGDETDLRFLDPPGHVVVLKFKTARNREKMLAKASDFVFNL